MIAYWPPAIGIGEHVGSMTRHIILTAIFVLAAVTDWFDGYLARTLNQTSAFGRFLDPVADKLMVAAAHCFSAVETDNYNGFRCNCYYFTGNYCVCFT